MKCPLPADLESETRTQGRRAAEVHRVAEVSVDLWREDETLDLNSRVELDDLAERLWRHWRRSTARSPAPRGFQSAVTLVAADLVGLQGAAALSGNLRVVEIASALYRALGSNKAPQLGSALGLARHRYESALIQADRVTLCLGATEQWSQDDRTALRQVLLDYRRLRRPGACLTLVVNKADLWMAERAYRSERLAHEPDTRSAEQYAREILNQRLHDDGLWNLISSTPMLRMRIASSLGWLTASGTYNIDLAPLAAPLEPGPEPQCLRPLWPRQGSNPRHYLPSQPDTLRHWRPIGVIEALFGCEVPVELGRKSRESASAGFDRQGGSLV